MIQLSDFKEAVRLQKQIIKKDKYKELQMKFGVVALLYVMQDHELVENYEECHCIKWAIEENNKMLTVKMPTTLYGLDVKQFVADALEHMNKQYTDEKYFTYLDDYITIIKNEINLLNP